LYGLERGLDHPMTGPLSRIAIGFDGSSGATEALRVAIWIAKLSEAALVVFGIAPTVKVYPPPGEPYVPRGKLDTKLAEYRALVDSAVQEARMAGVAEVSGRCEDAPVVNGLLDLLTAERVDLLVLGSARLASRGRRLHRSVSVELARRAPCSVLVVRTHE
jgi:nucleotide-binding universal stress UspA family protein